MCRQDQCDICDLEQYTLKLRPVGSRGSEGCMTQAVGRAPPSSRLILRPRAFTGLLSSETVAVSPTSFAQSQWGRQGVWVSECKVSRRSVPAAGLSSGLGGGPDRCVTQAPWETSWELDGGLRQALSLRTEQSPGAVSRPWGKSHPREPRGRGWTEWGHSLQGRGSRSGVQLPCGAPSGEGCCGSTCEASGDPQVHRAGPRGKPGPS